MMQDSAICFPSKISSVKNQLSSIFANVSNTLDRYLSGKHIYLVRASKAISSCTHP